MVRVREELVELVEEEGGEMQRSMGAVEVR